ncbi:amino acid adenylation domain-containing protein [Paenibacillus sp. FSL P2-0089]|uniref:non-ribosomal peptide synthetase n=1 Tax=Paenibacillus sp. FSL P2-0089 TaxID=2954526 RepID=UPI00315AA838
MELTDPLERYAFEKAKFVKKFMEKKGLKSKDIHPISIRDRNINPSVSFSQQRLWIMDQLQPGNPAYIIPMALLLRGPVVVSHIEECFKEIIRRHETLRTSFVADGEKVLQQIEEVVPFQMQLVSLENVPKEARQAAADEWIMRETRAPFDLSQAPLIRVLLIKCSDDEHILVASVHHIVSDGWSVGILQRELTQLYRYYQERGNKLPELLIQYTDYSEWQRKKYTTNELSAEMDYWKSKLQEAPGFLDLPTDLLRPAIQSFQGDTLYFDIEQDTANTLQQLAREENTTLFVVLLSLFSILLYKYSGNPDLIIGTPVAGRDAKEVENLVGLFINTLPLRIGLSGNPAIRDVIRQVIRTTAEAMSNATLPFDRIIGGLRLERELSHSALYQVMLIMQDSPMQPMKLGQATVEILEIDNNTSKCDLTLYMRRTNEGLKGSFEYCSELFHRSSIERMTEHFKHLIGTVITHQHLGIDEISMLTHKEYNELASWNLTGSEYDTDTTVYDLFERQVEDTPDSIAVICGEAAITYHDLYEKTERLARYLIKQDIQPGMLIGICMERSIDMIVSILAVIRTGAAYVPLDIGYPADRLNHMIEDSGMLFILTRNDLTADCGHQVRNIFLEQYPEHMMDYEPAEFPAPVPEDLMYVIYTSGSTGKPKGVKITHRSVMNFIHGLTKEIGFSSKKSILAVTSMSFDIFLVESLLPLTRGMKIILATDDEQRNPERLKSAIKKYQIKMLQMTPSRLNLLIQGTEDTGFLQGVQEILLGGETFPLQLLIYLNQHTNARIYNLFGPTETTVWSTIKELTGDMKISVGRPIANTQIVIVDEFGNLVPPGIKGEICIGGDGLSPGYYNQPELSDSRFVSLRADGTKVYKTGDLGKWLPGGDIQHLGRLDSQVKLRGYRIELTEVEMHIGSHPHIKECAVIMGKDPFNEDCLLGYYVTDNDNPLRSAEIVSYLSEQLPEYMIPQYWMQLQQLPLTPNGKVDKRSLPQIEPVSVYKDSEGIQPENEIQLFLRDGWEQALGAGGFGMEDNFFQIGGNSVMLVRLFNYIEKTYPGTVKITDLFTSPTIKAQSLLITSQNNKRADLSFKETAISEGVEILREDHPVSDKGHLSIRYMQIPESLTRRLEQGAAENIIEPTEIIMSAYIYVLYQIAASEQIYLYTMVHSLDSITPVAVDFGNIDHIQQLVNELRRQTMGNGRIIPLSHVIKSKVKNTLLPMVYLKECCRSESELNSLFDLLLMVDKPVKGTIKLKWTFHSLLDNAEEISSLLEMYLTTIDQILCEYSI